MGSLGLWALQTNVTAYICKICIYMYYRIHLVEYACVACDGEMVLSGDVVCL